MRGILFLALLALAVLLPDVVRGQNAGGIGVDDATSLVTLLNRARTDAKRTPVTVDPILRRAAQQLARDMADDKGFEHTAMVKTTAQYVQDAGKTTYHRFADNTSLCSRGLRAADLQKQLMNGKETRAILLDPRFRAVGVGIARRDSGREAGSVWVAQIFAGD